MVGPSTALESPPLIGLQAIDDMPCASSLKRELFLLGKILLFHIVQPLLWKKSPAKILLQGLKNGRSLCQNSSTGQSVVIFPVGSGQFS